MSYLKKNGEFILPMPIAPTEPISSQLYIVLQQDDEIL